MYTHPYLAINIVHPVVPSRPSRPSHLVGDSLFEFGATPHGLDLCVFEILSSQQKKKSRKTMNVRKMGYIHSPLWPQKRL